MKLRLLTQLNPEAQVEGDEVIGPSGTRCGVDAATAAALRAGGGEDLVAALCQAMPLAKALAALEQLRHVLAVCRTLQDEDRVLLRALPAGPEFSLETWAPAGGADAPLRLSRFALLRTEGGGLVMESPCAQARVRFYNENLLGAMPLLAAGASAASLAARLGSAELASALVDVLGGAGMIEEGTETPAMRAWEFYDLLFHARSRAGRSTAAYGALPERTVREETREMMRGERCVPLPRPAAGARLAALDAVLNRRRSQPHHGPKALSLLELGEFLFYSAHAGVHRPYPSAGGIYELEIYVGVNQCGGLEAGLYRYQPQTHALAGVSGPSADLQRLLEAAGRAARAAMPQTLLLLAARFGAVSSRYGSIAYALILKDAGVLVQTMYLVASAMGLAACAVGGGDADAFARASGLDYYTEGTVAELMLGRPADAARAK